MLSYNRQHTKVLEIDNDYRLKLVELLLINGAKSIQGRSVLVATAMQDNLSLVELLLDKGIDVDSTLNGQNNSWDTALYYAAKNKNLDMVTLLLANKASPNLVNPSSISPLDQALGNGEISISKALLEADARLSPLSLFRSVQSRNIECVKLILGNLRNFRNFDTNPGILHPLMEAIRQDNTEIIKLLIDADITYIDSEGNSLLHLAAKLNRLNVAKILLPELDDQYANDYADTTNLSGDTPLHLAAKNGSFHVAKYLIDRGANTLAPNTRSQTPVDLAIFLDNNISLQGNGHSNYNLRKSVLRGKLSLIKLLAEKGVPYNRYMTSDKVIRSFIEDLSDNKLKHIDIYLNL